QRSAGRSFGISGFRVYNAQDYVNFPYQNYDQLNWFGFYFDDAIYYKASMRSKLSTVTAETVQESSVSVDQLLSGQAAGVNISTGSGQPGQNATIIIRGRNSLDVDAEALFIIDGVPVSEKDFRSLNESDITNISVLKDAEATALYGNRGANGVII